MRNVQITTWTVAAMVGLALPTLGQADIETHPVFSGEQGELERIEPGRLTLNPEAEYQPVFQVDGNPDNPRREGPRPPWGPEPGDFEVTLSGSGVSDGRFREGGFGVDGSLGYYITRDIAVELRQNVTFEAFPHSAWGGATRLAGIYHFDLQRFRPFLGVSIGGFYGERIRDTAGAGLEGGLKYYVKPDTFLYGRVEHHWLFRSASTRERTVGNRHLLYTIGIGFNF